MSLQSLSDSYPTINPDDLSLFLYKCDSESNQIRNQQIINKVLSDSTINEDFESTLKKDKANMIFESKY